MASHYQCIAHLIAFVGTRSEHELVINRKDGNRAAARVRDQAFAQQGRLQVFSGFGKRLRST
jgi:hypothetical protein